MLKHLRIPNGSTISPWLTPPSRMEGLYIVPADIPVKGTASICDMDNANNLFPVSVCVYCRRQNSLNVAVCEGCGGPL